MAQIEYSIKDMYEQGRKNICLGLFKDQSDVSLYPSNFEKTSIVEIESFMSKLAILEPRKSHEVDAFRVITIIETDKHNKITLYNTQKLDKYGIRVYLDEEGEYKVYVKDTLQSRFMCTPNIRDIVSCVYNYILGEDELPKLRVFQKFYRSIHKTLTE